MGKIIERVRQRERIAADNRRREEFESGSWHMPGGITYVIGDAPESRPNWRDQLSTKFQGLSRFFFKP